MSAARFEIVRTDAGWFARFIAANGREVWRTSETYQRQAGVRNAVRCIVRALPRAEVRMVDEREARP